MIATLAVSHSDEARDKAVMRPLLVSGNIGAAPILIRAAETFASLAFHQPVNGSLQVLIGKMDISVNSA